MSTPNIKKQRATSIALSPRTIIVAFQLQPTILLDFYATCLVFFAIELERAAVKLIFIIFHDAFFINQ
jgi:hypothetical protein